MNDNRLIREKGVASAVRERILADSGGQSAGGRGGIRTHGGLAPTAVFKTAALNRSATLPTLWSCLANHQFAKPQQPIRSHCAIGVGLRARSIAAQSVRAGNLAAATRARRGGGLN